MPGGRGRWHRVGWDEVRRTSVLALRTPQKTKDYFGSCDCCDFASSFAATSAILSIIWTVVGILLRQRTGPARLMPAFLQMTVILAPAVRASVSIWLSLARNASPKEPGAGGVLRRGFGIVLNIIAEFLKVSILSTLA